MREDLQERKVYHYNQYQSEEYVLYDFNLEIGDEFIYNGNTTAPFVVVEKEIISSSLGDLYKWTLNNIGAPPIIYIEAIGVVDNFLVYNPFISDPVYWLNQAFSNCQEVYCNDISCVDVNPYAIYGPTEIYNNGIDDDCDPSTLDDDFDQDGFGPDDDCDDENASINPGQAEVAYNGIDDDCDPSTLDDDLDQDGFASANDCDDTNAAINSDQTEEPYNGIDDDCDPSTLDDDLDQDGFASANDCDDTNAAINSDQTEEPYNGIDDDCDPSTLDDDLDQDGFGIDNDCNDENANINPDTEEIANNGIDEDCDGADLISSIYTVAKASFEIYPNPAKNLINIQYDGGLNFKTSIFNADGVLFNSYSNPSFIDTSNLSQGVYFVNLIDLRNGDSYIKKLLIF